MTTEEQGDYGKGRRHSSSLLTRGDPSRYAPLGTVGTHPHYTTSNSKDNSKLEQRRSPQTIDHARHTSTQHHQDHSHSKNPSPTSTSASSNSDTRKRRAPSPPEPAGTLHSKDERRASRSDSESSSQHKASTRTTTPSSKRDRSTHNDESNENTSDTRLVSTYRSKSDYESNNKSDYKSDRTDYKSTRSTRSNREDWPDDDARGYHKDANYEQGRNSRDRELRASYDDLEDRPNICKKKLWVGGLPSDVTCEEIRKFFADYGKLIYVMISPKGNAFVKFSSEEQAYFAYKKCYTAYIREKPVRVKYAIRKPNKIPHNKLLYINNVPPTFTRTELTREFEKFGEIEDVQMFTVPYVYFFVTFVLEECAVRARKALKTKYFIQFGKIRADDKKVESPETFQIAEAPARALPLDISECKVDDVLEPLSEGQTLELSELLSDLQPTNSAIRVRRDWILEHTANINDILLHISVMLVAKDNPFTLRLSTLFLFHDLLSYCTQRRKCTKILDTVSAMTLPHIQRVINMFQVDSEQESESVVNILSLWAKYGVYPVSVVDDLRHKFTAGERDAQTEENW